MKRTIFDIGGTATFTSITFCAYVRVHACVHERGALSLRTYNHLNLALKHQDNLANSLERNLSFKNTTQIRSSPSLHRHRYWITAAKSELWRHCMYTLPDFSPRIDKF